MVRHVCPACGGPADLVHRKRLDRIVSAFYKVHRYACRDEGCGWEGLLRSSHRRPEKKAKGMRPWMWAVLVLVAAAVAAAMVIYFETRFSSE
jgi:hypothetical protein